MTVHPQPSRSIFLDVLPLVTSDRDLVATLGRWVREARPDGGVEVVEPPLAVEFLGAEMPELFFLDFDDPSFDVFALVETIVADPWLQYSGILALCDDAAAAERLENEPRANIIVVVGRRDLEALLPRLLRIFDTHHGLLFQRHVGADLVGDVSGQVRIANDVAEVRCYQNLVCNYLHNTNRIGADAKAALHLAINEMLMNAIEHGNCDISYEEKSAWLEAGHRIEELIARRCADPEIARRRVTFEYTITPECSRFRVADEGAGFDWRALRDPAAAENVLKRHGRGILMTQAFTSDLTYNEAGNEVRFTVRHESERANPTPALFAGIAARDVEKGEAVLQQGEISNSLFYIVKGRYDVLVDGREVAMLTPNDLLMGEISCLLHSRRSATIRARTAGRVVEISKRQLLEVIRMRPYYALVLCRLLAERLEARTRSLG